MHVGGRGAGIGRVLASTRERGPLAAGKGARHGTVRLGPGPGAREPTSHAEFPPRYMYMNENRKARRFLQSEANANIAYWGTYEASYAQQN